MPASNDASVTAWDSLSVAVVGRLRLGANCSPLTAVVHHRQINDFSLILEKTTQTSIETTRPVSPLAVGQARDLEARPHTSAARHTGRRYVPGQLPGCICICTWTQATH